MYMCPRRDMIAVECLSITYNHQQLTAVISLHCINLLLLVTHKLRYFNTCTVHLLLLLLLL